MGSISSPDLLTAPFGSGMLRLVLQLANLYRWILAGCGLLFTLLMGSISSLDLLTRPFESGVLILVLQLENPYRGIL